MRKITLLHLVCLFLFLSFNAHAQNLIDVEYKGMRTKAQLVAEYGPFIQNGIEMYKMTYETDDVFGQLDTASGLLVVPLHDDPTISPLLVYHHGTVDGPQDVPSNLQGGWQLAGVLGGMGYIAIAPDFLGAGEARGFHPYVHADSEASAAVDMIRAARQHATENDDLLMNDQIFITGYSQGGHAGMATHKSIEQDFAGEMEVTAASHMSGPYSISGVMTDLILSDVPYFYPAYLPNTFLSYNYVYGLYSDIEEVFKPEYAPMIENFFEGTIGLSTLNTFLINTLTTNTGASIAKNMLQDSVIAILESDDLTHPMRVALIDNDLYNWAPERPTRLMYCTGDDQVNFMNAVVADSVMNALGATNLDAMDVDPAADHGGCVTPATLQTVIFFAQYADFTVGTTVPPALKDLQVYPNPANNQLQISGLAVESEVSFYSLTGKLMHRELVTSPMKAIFTSHLPIGTYLLQFKGADHQYTKKIIIQR